MIKRPRKIEAYNNEALGKKRLLFTFMAILTLGILGCVEPIDFEVPEPLDQVIIQGMISDQEGPYTVFISRGVSIRPDSALNPPISNASVRLYDDLGNIEDFEEVAPGEYATRGAMRGEVGRSYHVRIELEDGSVLESLPDLLKPVGEIKDIYWEFESGTSVEIFGEVPDDVFNVFVDSDAIPEEENFMRWRMEGTFRIVTNPELFEVDRPWFDLPIPRPRRCSGYVVAPNPSGRGTIVVQERPCECCECWVNVFEDSPNVSDDRLVANGQFRNIQVGTVPVNSVSFFDKYMVSVEQMSLTRTAYDFFRLVEVQRTNANNIFQPPSGEIVGNVVSQDESVRVVGLFWASAVDRRFEFIQREDVPYPVTPPVIFPESCLLQFRNSTTERPPEW